MITINNYELKVTIFPDGTSQCWHLPEEILKSESFEIVWNFENEAELIYLDQLSCLLYKERKFTNLHIPYLPYARQDKEVSNNTTFALATFASFINRLMFHQINSVDVHNPEITKLRINNFVNQDVRSFHKHVYQIVQPTYLVFPDKGAAERYPYLMKNPHIVFEKIRDQSTGQIIGHKQCDNWGYNLQKRNKFLIVDDICDGGATFTSISKQLHGQENDIEVDLCVTHGIFSKGKEILYEAGINKIFTTNSLIKNKGEGVFEL